MEEVLHLGTSIFSVAACMLPVCSVSIGLETSACSLYFGPYAGSLQRIRALTYGQWGSEISIQFDIYRLEAPKLESLGIRKAGCCVLTCIPLDRLSILKVIDMFMSIYALSETNAYL